MPIPFLLLGAAAIGTAIGVSKTRQASNTFEEAQAIGDRASAMYEKRAAESIRLRNSVAESLKELTSIKITSFHTQIAHLVEILSKNKTASSKLENFDQSIIFDDYSCFSSTEVKAATVASTIAHAVATPVGTTAVALLLRSSTVTVIGGFVLKHQSENALTEALEYELGIEEKIGEIEQSDAELTEILLKSRERQRCIGKLCQIYDQVKVDDDSDEIAFDQMLQVGKALKNIMAIPVFDDQAYLFAKSKLDGALFIEIINDNSIV